MEGIITIHRTKTKRLGDRYSCHTQYYVEGGSQDGKWFQCGGVYKSIKSLEKYLLSIGYDHVKRGREFTVRN